LPIFADFCRFFTIFSRGNRVDNVSQVPGGFEGANLGKYLSKILINFFNPKKIPSKKIYVEKKNSKNWVSPPPLHFAFFEHFWSIFKNFRRILTSKHLAGEKKPTCRLHVGYM
jgi:hypothetical protein